MSADIVVIGTGYVGITTAACLAHLGHRVIGADIDERRVAQLSKGEIPIVEDGLEELVKEGLASGNLRFTTDRAGAAATCEFAYLCVPTPQSHDGRADLSHIEDVASVIGPVLPPESIVVNKSTVPVGSTRVVERVKGRGDVFVVANPEFLRLGSAVHAFLHPDHNVIGDDNPAGTI